MQTTRSKDIVVTKIRLYGVIAMAIAVWSFLFNTIVQILTWANRVRGILSSRSIVSGSSPGLYYRKSRFSILFKFIAIILIYTLLIQNISWAHPDKTPIHKHTLATQSVFKALKDEGIEDSAELKFELIAGVRLLLAGKSPIAVNGFLTEMYRNMPKEERKIKWLKDIEREDNRIRAKFKVIEKEDVTFEILYQDTILDEKYGDVSVEDAGIAEANLSNALQYRDVFQKNDVIRIARVKSKLIPPSKSQKLQNSFNPDLAAKSQKSARESSPDHVTEQYVKKIIELSIWWNKFIEGLEMVLSVILVLGIICGGQILSAIYLLPGIYQQLSVWIGNGDAAIIMAILAWLSPLVVILIMVLSGEIGKKLEKFLNFIRDNISRKILPNLSLIGKLWARALVLTKSESELSLALLALENILTKEGLELEIYQGAFSAIFEINKMKPALIKPNTISAVALVVYRTIPPSHSLVHYQIYLNKTFNGVTSEVSPESKFSIGLSAYRLLKQYNLGLTDTNIRKATDFVIKNRIAIASKPVFSEERTVINIAHNEKRFMSAEQESLEQRAGVKPVSISSFKGKDAKNNILTNIEESKNKLTIFFNGHGGKRHIWLDSGLPGTEDSDDLDTPFAISFEELGKALYKRVESNGKDSLGDIVILIHACYSYNFCVNLLRYLIKRGITTTPIIISSSNFDRSSYGDVFSEGILTSQQQHGGNITMQDIFNAEEYAFHSEDIAVFIPINPNVIEDIFDITTSSNIDYTKMIQSSISKSPPSSLVLNGPSVNAETPFVRVPNGVVEIGFRFPEYIWRQFKALLKERLGDAIYNNIKTHGLAWTDAEGVRHWIDEILGKDESKTVWKAAIEAINKATGKNITDINEVKKVIEYHENLHALFRDRRYKELIANFKKKLEDEIFKSPLTEIHPFIQAFIEVYGTPHTKEPLSEEDRLNWYLEEFLVLSMQEKELFNKPYGVLKKLSQVQGLPEREAIADAVSEIRNKIAKLESAEQPILKKQHLRKEHRDEKELLLTVYKYLKNYPVNMTIDLSLIPKQKDGLTEEQEKRQLEENMKTLARSIAWHNMFGLDVRYILEKDYEGRAKEILRNELTELSAIPGLSLERLLASIDTPHSDPKTIEIQLKSLEAIKQIKTIPDRTYPVALKENKRKPNISIPNYSAASSIGLSLAALRVANEERPEEYERKKRKMLDKFRSIYERYGVDVKGFTEDVLHMMVTNSPKTRLYYAILYALPPIVKTSIEKLSDYHEKKQLLLQAA